LDTLQRWYRILSEALRYFLKGRQPGPPLGSTQPDRLPWVVSRPKTAVAEQPNCLI
jgi:hypothetical protein